jgi:cytochrome P450
MTQQTPAVCDQASPEPSHNDPAIYDWLRDKRDSSPIYFDETIHAWRVFRYDDILRILRDSASFSNDMPRVMPQQSFTRGNVAMMDPPKHTQIRAIVSRAFTSRVVALLEPRVAEITNQLLDAAAARGNEIDLIEDLAYPMPVMVIADLLGVPRADQELFRRWADSLLSIKSGDIQTAEFVDAIEGSQRELHDYLLQRVSARRMRPGDDLISGLLAADVDGQRLDDEEIANFCSLLLMGGHVTTTLILGNAMLCLDMNPKARAEVQADRTKLPRLIEEVLRYRPVFIVNARVTNCAVDLRGHAIPANALIFSSLMSANHDERQFPEPERFDIHRDPNPHLGFGHGIHYCMGAPLGRLETRLALDILLTRYPDLMVTPGSTPEFYETGLCGVKSLAVTLERV